MTFRVYPRYRDSGVEWLGRVPHHWELKRLGFYFAERRERVSDTEYQPLSVTKNGVVPQLETAAKTDDNDNRKRVCVGDFVINSRSDRKGSSGLSDLAGSVSLINTVLRPQERVHARFVHHLLRCQPFQEEFYRFGKGIVSDLWSTNYSDMRNILLAMPPLAEQCAIAAFLDVELAKLDNLVANQQRLIELIGEKTRAVISHVVTKGLNAGAPMSPSVIDWLGDLPAHWTIPPLFTRYEAVLGKMLDEKQLTGKHPMPYLRNADVNWDWINTTDLPTLDIEPSEMERYSLRPGDVLICEGGAGVGQTAVWQGELESCAFQKALHRLRARSTDENPRYLYYCLRFAVEGGAVLATGNTSTIPHFTGEKVRRLRLPCPPRREQDQIVQHLDAITQGMKAVVAEADRGIALLQERRTALISAAVTGDIDVRDLVGVAAA